MIEDNIDKRKHEVSIYNKNGNRIKTFKSVTEATEYLHVDITTVSRALNGVRKTCNDYIVRYGNEEIIESFKPSSTDKRTILQCSSDDKVVNEWNSIHDAARGVNCDPSNISKCLRGNKKTCKGFLWKYKI